MTSLIVFEDLAQNHVEKLKKSGDKSSLKKLAKILNELEIHPRIGLGNPEQLKYQLSGYWSWRINKKDRLIYEIIENPEKQVVIVSALGHY
jgi:toxin YoeB